MVLINVTVKQGEKEREKNEEDDDKQQQQQQLAPHKVLYKPETRQM